MGKALNFNDLKNKVCIITGGGGIIGQAIAAALSFSGVKIAILDFDENAGKEAAANIKKETGNDTFSFLRFASHYIPSRH